MRYALISDIHGNLPALDAVLDHIDGRDDIDAIVHLGDLVGYAPFPNEVVQRLVEWGITGVGGNYDSTTAAGYEHCGCTYEDPVQAELSHQSYAWTRAHVTDETRRRLAALPFRLDLRPLGGHTSGPRLILIHGNPILNTVYWTEDRSDGFCAKMAEKLGARAGDWIAFGHTHLPWHREVDGIHFVNTGSVGRPKDGDPRAGYVTVEFSRGGAAGSASTEAPEGAGHVEFVRVEYDVTTTAEAIRASDLPDAFATFLESGGHRLD